MAVCLGAVLYHPYGISDHCIIHGLATIDDPYTLSCDHHWRDLLVDAHLQIAQPWDPPHRQRVDRCRRP